MTRRFEFRQRHVRLIASSVIFIVLLFASRLAASDTLILNKEGVKTAFEGDLIEYNLEVVNAGAVSIDGVEVLDVLPAEVGFVDAIPTPGGVYNPLSGVWSLPTLGTGVGDKTAELIIRAQVGANLITDPTRFVTVTNQADITAPMLPSPVSAEANTNIVCAFCIDWEIVSVVLESDQKVEPPDPFKSRYFLYVQVANNGPVMSEAAVSLTRFNISGGGFSSVKLKPVLPVPVTLDVGESQTITYSTGWHVGPTSDYKISWAFEVNDIARMDPVLPNTAAGSWSGKVKGGPGGSGGGGCTINKQATTDPLWLMIILVGLWRIGRKLRCKTD